MSGGPNTTGQRISRREADACSSDRLTDRPSVRLDRGMTVLQLDEFVAQQCPGGQVIPIE
jgi:hypothetical protein